MSQFLQLHPSREPCRIAQCKLYSLPLSLFAHFSSALQKTQTCKHTHTHRHFYTEMHGSPFSSTAAERNSTIVIIVVVVWGCTVSRKCYCFLHAVCIKQGTTRKAPCVCHCVCSVALLRLSTVMWIHNPISHKNFEERLQWEIPLISTTKCLEMFRRSRIHIFEAFALILASFMMELKLGLHYIWLLLITAN